MDEAREDEGLEDALESGTTFESEETFESGSSVEMGAKTDPPGSRLELAFESGGAVPPEVEMSADELGFDFGAPPVALPRRAETESDAETETETETETDADAETESEIDAESASDSARLAARDESQRRRMMREARLKREALEQKMVIAGAVLGGVTVLGILAIVDWMGWW